jgi:glycerophosphoryl diester phosphodiesterase
LPVVMHEMELALDRTLVGGDISAAHDHDYIAAARNSKRGGGTTWLIQMVWTRPTFSG